MSCTDMYVVQTHIDLKIKFKEVDALTIFIYFSANMPSTAVETVRTLM